VTLGLGVAALGLACPLGLSARAACVAIRAGINARQELPYTDAQGEPLIGAMLERIAPHQPRRHRWLALTCYALFDMLGERMAEFLAQVPLVLVLPDPEAATPQGIEQLRRDLAAQLDVELPPRFFHVVVGGASAGLRALANARTLLATAPACIVLAADSLVDARTLLALQQRRRLVTSTQPDGLHPGEAAACVLLQPAPRPSWGSVVGLGVGHEPASFDNDIPLRAEGLVQATRAALVEAGLALHDLDFRMCDATGESFVFKEHALLPARLLRRRKETFPLWLSAAMLGHVGTAAGLCGLVITLDACARGHAPGQRALLLASGDEGERAAAVVVGVGQGTG
jgi:3-oxoacyl-[acyl-carrier-protein] synthase-1